MPAFIHRPAQRRPPDPAPTIPRADWPEQMLITVTFDEEDGKTKLTLRSPDVIGASKERDDAEQGWTESLGRLADHLAQA
jgi:hypothetical protein